jgi:hypothetical protein
MKNAKVGVWKMAPRKKHAEVPISTAWKVFSADPMPLPLE